MFITWFIMLQYCNIRTAIPCFSELIKSIGLQNFHPPPPEKGGEITVSSSEINTFRIYAKLGNALGILEYQCLELDSIHYVLTCIANVSSR